jgi:hypothetical protein
VFFNLRQPATPGGGGSSRIGSCELAQGEEYGPALANCQWLNRLSEDLLR